MKMSLAALSLLLLTVFCIEVHSTLLDTNCCYTYVQKRIPLRQIKNYYITSSLCAHPGVIFTTKKEMEFCTNPNDNWVQKNITDFNKKTKKAKKAKKAKKSKKVQHQ
ncbi:C-C motif chemokine 3-like [Discoglossus pictus]